MEVNAYVVQDRETKDACLIDPGGAPEVLKSFLKRNGLVLKFIINTHGHGDHIAANRYFNAPVYIHRLDEEFLTDPEKNLAGFLGFFIRSPRASRLLEDGERIPLGKSELEIMHTPGHTPGSISVRVDGVVFTGDALFNGGIGRTDFSYGDSELLLKSIRGRLLTLGDEIVIYPGHGGRSTIGDEKRTNPFL